MSQYWHVLSLMSYNKDSTCAIYFWIAVPKTICSKPLHKHLTYCTNLSPCHLQSKSRRRETSNMKSITCVILLKYSRRTYCSAKKRCIEVSIYSFYCPVWQCSLTSLKVPLPVIHFHQGCTVLPVINVVSFTFHGSIYR